MALDATATENTVDSPQTGNIAADRLRSLIERIERLEEERKALPATSKTSTPSPKAPDSTSR